MKNNYRVTIRVYNEATNEEIDKVDTYLHERETEDIEGRWEMAEVELGNLQRRVEKKILNLENICQRCGGSGYIEIMGDGENFEWDVVGTKPCPECQSND